MSVRSEQGKLPTTKAFRLAERDKHMSEQEKPMSYMEELDQWIEEEVFENLYALWQRSQDGDMAASGGEVKKAIREKIRESYHNGQKSWTAQSPGQEIEMISRRPSVDDRGTPSFALAVSTKRERGRRLPAHRRR
jgi:hypothetical protein